MTRSGAALAASRSASRPVAGVQRRIARRLQRRVEEAQDLRLVVDDEDARAGHVGARARGAGRSTSRAPRRRAAGLSAQMRPPIASIEAARRWRGRGRRRAGDRRCGRPGEISRRSVRGRPALIPGPSSVTETTTSRPTARACTRTGRSPPNFCALSSRLNSTCSIRPESPATNGRSSARLISNTRVGKGLARPLDRGAHDVAEVDQFALRLQRAGLDARHVEQVGDEAGQPRRLLLDAGEQILPALRRQRRVELAQRRRRAGDRGERRAQVVRERGEQRRAQLVVGLEARRLQRLARQRRAVEGDRGLIEDQVRACGRASEPAPTRAPPARSRRRRRRRAR